MSQPHGPQMARLLGWAAQVTPQVRAPGPATVAAYRANLDPDTYGIPVVSSTVDFVGAFTLIIAIALLGLS